MSRRDAFTKVLLHLNVINKHDRDLATTTPVLVALGTPGLLLVSAWLSSSLCCIKISVYGELNL